MSTPGGTRRRRTRVVTSVVADLESRDRQHNVGHIGSRYLMPVLAAYGHAQLALNVLRRDGSPGWKQWLDQGHLTFMEMWDEPRSSCHYFHGTPAVWLYEGLVGLRRYGQAQGAASDIGADDRARGGQEHRRSHLTRPPVRVTAENPPCGGRTFSTPVPVRGADRLSSYR